MTDETPTPANENPAPAAPEVVNISPTVDAPPVESATSTTPTFAESLASEVVHKAEQDTHHALSHLEAEAVAIFITWPEDQVKALLAWVASKL